MPIGIGVDFVVFPTSVLRRDILKHSVQVGIATRFVLDRRDAAGRMCNEHGAQAVADIGVIDHLLRERRHIVDLAIALGLEAEVLMPCQHWLCSSRRPFVDRCRFYGAEPSLGRTVSEELDIALTGVPDALLGIVVETAHAVLRELAPADVSVAARPLLRFDRRGLASGAARRQVLAALRREPQLRAMVVEALTDKAEVVAMLDEYSVLDAPQIAVNAVDRDDLGLLVAALWAGAPSGAAFGIGVCVSAAAARQAHDAAAHQVHEVERQLDEATVAVHRADQRMSDADAAAAKALAQLREERAARRQREQSHGAEVAAAERATRDVETTLAQERANALTATQRAARDQHRIADLEQRLIEARNETATLRLAIATPALSETELRGAAGLAQQLAETLGAMGERVAAAPVRPVAATRAVRPPNQSAPTAGERPPAPTRRALANLPGGLLADSADGATAMLTRSADLVLIVDGYNVSKRAWPESALSEQREKLARALHQIHLRFGCDVVCCFDGDGTEGVRPLRRAGLRIVFSARGQEADELVVDAIDALPKRIPVVVASSDAWVREHAERSGGTVISAATALELARLAGRR